MTDLCVGHGLWPRAVWGPHTTLSYDDSILTKKLRNCAEAQPHNLPWNERNANVYISAVTTTTLHLGVRDKQAVCMKAFTAKEWKRKNTVFNWCSIFHSQKARNNTRAPDTAKLRWKAIFSVLDPTIGSFCKISRNRDCLLKLCVLSKSPRSVSRELYLEKRV